MKQKKSCICQNYRFPLLVFDFLLPWVILNLFILKLKQDDVSANDIKALLKDAPGVVLQDDPENQLYPMPANCVGKNDVFVGRIRKDIDEARGFHMWVVSDNLLKGAAWNSVQIAESLVKLGISKIKLRSKKAGFGVTMKIIVQKFGGTSVKDEKSRKHAKGHIEKALADGYKVVVVVCAMGRKGDPYATDTLLSLIGGNLSKISKREHDLLLSCGEVISSVVFANMLLENGIKAVALTGAQAGFRTNNDHTNAKII